MHNTCRASDPAEIACPSAIPAAIPRPIIGNSTSGEGVIRDPSRPPASIPAAIPRFPATQTPMGHRVDLRPSHPIAALPPSSIPNHIPG